MERLPLLPHSQQRPWLEQDVQSGGELTDKKFRDKKKKKRSDETRVSLRDEVQESAADVVEFEFVL